MDYKFFDPETGKPLHRVPEGATIPAGTPFGYIGRTGAHHWAGSGVVADVAQDDALPRFTREPIASPKPPLPTEPGLYLDKDGKAVERTDTHQWFRTGSSTPLRDVKGLIPLTPATPVPTETWNRLRVLDPEDKRDRVDADGDFMEFTTQSKANWGEELAARHWNYGPLRFADEVTDDA